MKWLLPLVVSLFLPGCDRDITGSLESGQLTNKEPAYAARAELAPVGKVIKAGLFKMVRSGGLVDSPDSSTGKAHARPVIQLVKQTDRIPLVKNAHMSFQYRIWGLPERPVYIDLRRVLIHPPMTLPDGTVSTGSDYNIKGHVSIGQVIAYTGYGLNEDYEMVEGDWLFQIWFGDALLVEQTFTTYWPEEAAP